MLSNFLSQKKDAKQIGTLGVPLQHHLQTRYDGVRGFQFSKAGESIVISLLT